MTEKSRRPFHFYGPYKPEQYETFRDAYAYAVRREYKETEALAFFDAKWPEIRGAADLCGRQLSIWWHLNNSARVRGLRANRFRNLRKAASCSDVRQLFEKHPEQVDTLLYGALRAGVIKPIDGRDDYSEELIQLRQITPDQLKIAVAAAAEKGSVLVDNKTRPSKAPVNNYIQFLVETLFSHATNTPSGPAAVWAFEAALAPFKLSLTESGVRRLVRRVGRVEEKGRQQR